MSQRANKTIGLGRAAAAVAGLMLLAGCSETPDWANPVEWYHSAASVFEDQPSPDVAKAREEAKKNESTSEGSDQSFPKLSSVPDRPKDLGAQSKNVQEGLAADRADARHVDVDAGPGDEEASSSGGGGASEANPSSVPGTSGTSGSSSLESSSSSSSTTNGGASLSDSGSAPPPPSPPAGGTSASAGSSSSSSTSTSSSSSGTGSQASGGTQVASAQDSGAPTGPPSGTKPSSDEVSTVVYFGNDSSKLSGKAVSKLKNIVNSYKKHGGTVRVVGYASSRTRNTDEVTHRLVNFRISLDRAEAVARELAKLGIPADKVEVRAVADNDPVNYEIMPTGDAGNRRTEIFLDY